MSDRCLELRRESGHIPSGRQLPRTPPLIEVKRHLDFSNEDPEEPCETVGSRGPDESELYRSLDSYMHEPRTDLSGHAMLKGMKGYQLTPSDLEFIRTMQEDKLLRTLQRDLEEVKKLLKMETVEAEKSFALREQAQAELDKLPSSAELAAWARAVLVKTKPRPPAGLDAKRLLSMVKKEDVQRLVREKEARLAWLEELVDKKKKEAEEREKQEKELAGGQLKVRELMSEFSNVKLELEREEEVQKMLQSRVNIKEKVAIKETIREQRDAKNQKRRGKEVETAAGSEDGVERKRPPRRRVASAKTDKLSSANDASETAKTNLKTVKATRAARQPQREEDPVPRGRGTPPRRRVRRAAESSSSRGQTAAEVEEAAPNAGLRRSKRIANRK